MLVWLALRNSWDGWQAYTHAWSGVYGSHICKDVYGMEGNISMSAVMFVGLTVLYELCELRCCGLLRNKEEDGTGLRQKDVVSHDSIDLSCCGEISSFATRADNMPRSSAEARIRVLRQPRPCSTSFQNILSSGIPPLSM